MFNIISHWGNTNQNNETPLCMAINKNIKPKQKITVNKDMETLFFMYYWWECKEGFAMGSSISILKELNIKLPYDPTIPLLGVYPKEPKAGT